MFHRPIQALAAAAALFSLAACEEPAPKTSFGGIPFGDYVLVGIGGGTIPLRNVTMKVEETRLSGRGPCNGYTVPNTVELPALALGPMVTTQATCKDQDLENRFFQTLQSANQIEYYGEVLKVKSPHTWLIFERGVPAAQAVSALDQARADQGMQ